MTGGTRSGGGQRDRTPRLDVTAEVQVDDLDVARRRAQDQGGRSGVVRRGDDLAARLDADGQAALGGVLDQGGAPALELVAGAADVGTELVGADPERALRRPARGASLFRNCLIKTSCAA